MSKKPSVRLRRAMETNDAVERIVACTNQLQMELAAIPGGAENVRRARSGQMTQWKRSLIDHYGADKILEVSDHVSRNAVVDIWRQQGRIAYDLHPEMAANLYRAQLKGKLPGGLFNRLPHISPMLPLPRPWPFRSNDGTEGLIRAYFLTGRTGRVAFCSTTDPRSDGLAIMPWIEWDGARPGNYADVATPLFTLPATEEPFSLDDILDHTGAWHNARAQGGEMKMVRQILPGFLSVLSYLCVDNREVEEPKPAPAPRGRRQQAPSRDPFYVRVGWHIGSKLHAQRLRAKEQAERAGVAWASGVEFGPQHRAGHFKTVHHGEGKKLSSGRWVDPYWTKLEMLEEMHERGEEPGTGVIPVDAQRKDPAARRDVRLANLGTAKAKEIREREAQQQREADWNF